MRNRKNTDPVMVLIYESARLLSNYIELLHENSRLKAKVKALERVICGTKN